MPKEAAEPRLKEQWEMHLLLVSQVTILSSSYFIMFKSLLLKDLLKQVKIQYLAKRHYWKTLKRHPEEGQDLP